MADVSLYCLRKQMFWCHYQLLFGVWLRISPNILTNWNILRITFFLLHFLLHHYTRSSCIVVRTFNLFCFHLTFSLSLSLSLSALFLSPSRVFLIGFECSLQHDGIQNKTIMGHMIYDHNKILL